jgi:glyoxylase-like metal-dependent hydrolase (beta-lactamase superfamily II)
VISHLHYDHAGDHAAFGGATFVLQDAELSFWTGRYAHRRELLRHIETDDIVSFTHYSLDGRVRFVDGDRELLPGVSVHRVGGHTPGMQVLRVQTPAGPIVLASDAAHMAENLATDAPTSVFTDLPGVYAGFDRMLELAEGRPDRIYAGHDATLLDRLENVPGLEGIAGIVV